MNKGHIPKWKQKILTSKSPLIRIQTKYWTPKQHRANTTKLMFIQEDGINLALIKKTMTEKKKKITIPQKPRLQKVKVETKTVNKELSNIPTGNINELNKQINAGAKRCYSPGGP